MQNVFITQNSFTTGEISPEVAERTDLEKYKSALLQAENAVVSPYGNVSRRTGSKYIGAMKYTDKEAVLVPFIDSTEQSYLLEVGYKYIRVWKDEVMEQEIATPFEYPKELDFTQSGDTAFICSGRYPVHELLHGKYWELRKFDIPKPYFDDTISAIENVSDVNYTESDTPVFSQTKAGDYTFTPTVSGLYKIVLFGGGGGLKNRYYDTHCSSGHGGGSHCYLRAQEFGFDGDEGEKKTYTIRLNAKQIYAIHVGKGGTMGKGGRVNLPEGTNGYNPACNGTSGEDSTFTDDSKETNLVAKGGANFNGVPFTYPRWTAYKKKRQALLNEYQLTENRIGENPELANKINLLEQTENYGFPTNYYRPNPWLKSDTKDILSLPGACLIYFLSADKVDTPKPDTIDNAELKLTGSNITSNNAIFFPYMKNTKMKIVQTQQSKSVEMTLGENEEEQTSGAVYVGEKWKISTSGIHNSRIVIERSLNGQQWHEYRKYISKDDQNFMESGSEKEKCYLRVKAKTQGKINTERKDSDNLSIVLSALPFENEGIIEITDIVSPKEIKYTAIEPVIPNVPVDAFAFSSWNDRNGYPKLSCFFQDRLVFAGTRKEPYSLWFSRTGDYNNFSVEKAEGTVTEDSAIKLDLIVRNLYEIRHLVPSNDLIVLTSGNEWIISGDTAITPTKCTPKVQTMRGASKCRPWHIGNRLVYVQRDGGTVRDFGYSYDSDNYNGDELNLFASHLTKRHQMVSSAYCQNPYSTLYFVREDGEIVCLMLIKEQNVCAWTHWNTKGKYLDCCSITENGKDYLYVIVARTIHDVKGNLCTVRYLEKFDLSATNDTGVYLDCWTTTFATIMQENQSIQINAPQLNGERVYTIAKPWEKGGWRQRNTEVIFDGGIDKNKTSKPLHKDTYDIYTGLKFKTHITFPCLEMASPDLSLRGRTYKLNQIYLSLYQSYGGELVINQNKYEEFRYNDIQYTYLDSPQIYGVGIFPYVADWDIVQTVPQLDKGISSKNVLGIRTDTPYPFTVKSITKEITVGGGMVHTYNGGGIKG